MSNTSRILDQCRRELVFDLVRASGPGGQNVNKVSTALQLRFDIRRSRVLDPNTKGRLTRLAGKRVSTQGVLVIRAARYRTQAMNKKDALDRFAAVLVRALEAPKRRLPTAATAASRERRLQLKKRRGETKRTRSNPSDE